MIRNQKRDEYNDGVVRIYDVINIAALGEMAIEGLSLKQSLRYRERTVGIKRFYSAKQNNAEVKYVLRVQRRRDVSSQDIAMPNDGLWYRIDQVQYPEDRPMDMDLILVDVQQKYKIAGAADA